MRSRVRPLVAIVTLAFALGGCGADDPIHPAVDTTDHRVDGTLQTMNERYAAFLKSCDHKGIFALAYLRTTEEYKRAAADPAYFQDQHYLADEDQLFAKYYFDHVDDWTEGRKDKVPPAWTLSFQSSDSRAVNTLGDALLGISAHINQDLPYVIATLGVTDAKGQSRKPDHDKVNDFLAKVSFNQDIKDHWDPTFDADYASGLPIILAWREDAWNNANKILAAKTPADRAAVDKAIEDNALQVGQGLANISKYMKGDSSASRDAFCVAHP